LWNESEVVVDDLLGHRHGRDHGNTDAWPPKGEEKVEPALLQRRQVVRVAPKGVFAEVLQVRGDDGALLGARGRLERAQAALEVRERSLGLGRLRPIRRPVAPSRAH
jgi:hypothetical protein